MEDDGDKTEEPSPYKLGDAREKGDVAKSRDLENFFLFLGSVMALYFASRQIFTQLVASFKNFFDFNRHPLDGPHDYINLISGVMTDIVILIAPVLGAVFVLGVGGYLAQFGFIFTAEKISPDFSKMNPIQGFKKFFSKESYVELLRSTIKVAFISVVLYLTFRGEIDRLVEMGSYPVPYIFMYFVKLIGQVLIVLLIFMGVLGVADFLYQKWAYLQKMRSTVREMKEEVKRREGDPQIKARIRQIQRDRIRQRMMEKVPKADVVVTNPTHVAVALQYKKGQMRAPVVVAKGAGYIAVTIKELAIKSEVPILERKQLARFLYRNVEIGEAIPESLYTAVAEVLAYVYKIKNRFKQWRASQA